MLQTYYHFVKPNVVHYHSDLASVSILQSLIVNFNYFVRYPRICLIFLKNGCTSPYPEIISSYNIV